MNSAERAAFTPCRRRLSPATRKQGRPRKPTGRGYLYAELAAIAPSPIVELNRAVAVGMAGAPEAALSIVDRLVRDPRLKSYHLLLSVRGDLLDKLGRYGEARAEFEAAAGLAGNRRERDLLRRRAAKAAELRMSS
jgi:predicted RNA polymerase sigma factor